MELAAVYTDTLYGNVDKVCLCNVLMLLSVQFVACAVYCIDSFALFHVEITSLISISGSI